MPVYFCLKDIQIIFEFLIFWHDCKRHSHVVTEVPYEAAAAKVVAGADISVGIKYLGKNIVMWKTI